MTLHDRLLAVRTLHFSARSAVKDGWVGEGVGEVAVAQPASDTLIFTESGRWKPTASYETRFSNTYRWTFLAPDLVRLEHLRFGAERPVLLFDLEPDPESVGCWRSVGAHHCQDDCYTATLTMHGDAILLEWVVAGPRKSNHIAYRYEGC